MNRAWTYIISKELSPEQLQAIREAGEDFVKGWTAHEQQLTGHFSIEGNRIIVVKVNEDVHGASGCSIDKLTRFVKQLESTFSIELMNRLLVAYKNNNAISVVHSSKIKELLAEGKITEDTLVYNTSLSNQEELQNWEQPLKKTWLSKYLIAS
ncbi:MAG: transporter ATPase [Bacteroidetes bacterium]|jgi:hypothetical protein|nr:transporter ATPase [Bacteroidota bacterium]